jgi:putative methionine-R-sulfoxide reductase with GAF domain
VTGEITSLESDGVRELEFAARLRSVKVGVWLSVIVCVGGALYAVERWDQPNRELILVIIALGLLSAPLIRTLPLERIVRSRGSELFFVAWSLADVALIATIAALDGGSDSAYMLLLVLPFLFAALSYPGRTIVIVGLSCLAAFFIVAFGVGGGIPLSGFGLFAGACVALMGTWEARNQARERNRLSATAVARLRSERNSRRQAHQQAEVARFGQLALEGTDIDELGQEASRILTEVLEIDYGGVMKLDPSGEELLLVAADGLPKELVGAARIPAGYRSQSGYALATGMSIVVNDWDQESRFQQSELQRTQGMKSAATILIKGKGQPFGVIGAGSRRQREFTQGDVDFMQALANVLANAIERLRAEEQTQH